MGTKYFIAPQFKEKLVYLILFIYNLNLNLLCNLSRYVINEHKLQLWVMRIVKLFSELYEFRQKMVA